MRRRIEVVAGPEGVGLIIRASCKGEYTDLPLAYGRGGWGVRSPLAH
jgi:hypothetical protein